MTAPPRKKSGPSGPRSPSSRPPPAVRPPPIAVAPVASLPWRLGAIAAVLLAVVIGWRVRMHVTRATPTFDERSPVGMLKSDPALLFWFTERIAANGGAIPEDFAATRAIQWPEPVDARVEFPMTQPWLAANLWRWLGGDTALHVFCASLFALLAASTAVGVHRLALELTRRHGLALLALSIWLLLPANWRTTGFVLMGEDVAFPAFAWHLWLLARAARVRTAASFLVAGLPLALAMAAWHATGFFVAIEAGAVFAWYLRSGRNPFAVPRSWLVLLPFVLACAVEPMLRGKLQLLSLPMQLALALIVMVALEARRPLAPLVRAAAAIGVALGFLGLSLLAARWLGGGMGDYSHVFGLIAAKLRFLGELPADPAAIPFEVRILWQGPFDTTSARALWLNLSTAMLGAAMLAWLAFPSWARGRGDGREAVLALGCAAALLASWLINRTLIFSGLLFPVATVVALRELVRSRAVLAGAAVLLLLPPAWTFSEFLAFAKKVHWHDPVQKQELIGLVDAIERLVPPGAPIAADEVNATAILAHTGRPMLAQPKYEWAAARARLEAFRDAAIRGTPQELADFLRRHDCRHLAFDWNHLWGTRYQAGVPQSALQPASDSALWIAAREPDRLPGFKLLWKSPLQSDRLRLYELAQD